MADNSVEAITERLDEHDADARSWLNTITPTDVRFLLSELAQAKADLAKKSCDHCYSKSLEARAERAEAEVKRLKALPPADEGKCDCGHNTYWTSHYGSCMACRAERSEALAKEQERVIAECLPWLEECAQHHRDDWKLEGCDPSNPADTQGPLGRMRKALTPEPAKEER